MIRYADLFRPNYEAVAAATWFGSACIVSVLAVTAPFRANPFGWVALGAFMMALVRAIPAWRHWRRRDGPRSPGAVDRSAIGRAIRGFPAAALEE